MKTQLGHYEIVDELGRGGMGVVYKGFEPALNRYVAIKELSPSLAHDSNLVERFLREARSMAALNDPHIIQIYYIGTEEETGQPFFAMEFVEGDSLSGLLKREGKLSVENALKIMRQTAMGLATAHDKGVIHRDLKPGNLMLTPRGHVKIADFGIALATQDFAKKLTSTGEFVGTPGYLSPEVCLGKTVDQRSDIFALGIVLYEMLAGRMPFVEESPLGMMLEVVKAEIPDIRSINNAVDPQCAGVLSKMLAKEPADRFQNCHELVAALEAHPLVAKGGTVQLNIAKPSPADATVVGAPTPGSQKQRVPTPPPVARTPASSAAAAAPPQQPPAHDPTRPSAARPSALERPERRASRLPMMLAAAALVLAVGLAFAFRGTIGELLIRSDDPAIAANPPAEPAATPNTSAASNAASSQPAVQVGQGPAGDSPPTISTVSAAGSQGTALDPQLPTVEAGSMSGPSQAQTDGLAANDNGSVARPALAKALLGSRGEASGGGQQIAKATPPTPVSLPVPPRVAVVSLGDRALADSAKQLIEERLLAEGFDVLDLSVISGVEGRDLPGVFQALRREATMLVVVRADPLGSENLAYYGQSSTVYTANLSVRAYLIGDRRPLGAGFREKVMFATLNMEEKASEAVTPRLRQIVQELIPHRSRKGQG
ncbi:serine/threonine-protein kinase [Pseudomarimonas arenosa]|uniref:non-specific serine/threonine protein kinase n=1 Tax=Pseudomarimonas arenosa TaxID=2774145 RepID=A0AAW3ZS80_9GAMM|nr:serine/threonine-protein kinase [Pseudomarimonas arenosa]MBD8527952.1 protein kinase [Pseudomarimonas arenosa]